MKENRFERKKAKTREKIYSAALALFLEKGYEQTTVQEIVNKADVAKGTFFVHFPTKDALLSYLGEQRVSVMEKMLTKTLQEKLNANEKFVCLLTVLGEMNEESREITMLLSKQIFQRLLRPGHERSKDNQLKLKKIFIQILEEGQQNGEFRQNVNAVQAVDNLIAIYFFTLFQWLENPEISFTKEILDKYKMLMEGIESK